MHSSGVARHLAKSTQLHTWLRTYQLEDIHRLASVLGGAARELGLGLQAQCAPEKRPLIPIPKKTAKTNC